MVSYKLVLVFADNLKVGTVLFILHYFVYSQT